MPRNFRQKSLLVATIPQPKTMAVDYEYKVRTKRMRVTELYKLLISYFIYEGKDPDKNEIVKEMLGITYLKILDLRSIKLLRSPDSTSVGFEKMLVEKILREGSLNKEFLPLLTTHMMFSEIYFKNENEYYGKVANSEPIILGHYRRPKKQHHWRFVGVGYKDKGSAKIPNIDCSPSWQEVAQYGDRTTEITEYTNARRIKNFKVLETSQVSVLTQQLTVFGNPKKITFRKERIYLTDEQVTVSLLTLDESPYRSNEHLISQEELYNLVYDSFRTTKMTISPVKSAGGSRRFILQ